MQKPEYLAVIQEIQAVEEHIIDQMSRFEPENLKMTESIHEDKKVIKTMVRLKSYNKTLCHDLSYRLHTMESCLAILVRVKPASLSRQN